MSRPDQLTTKIPAEAATTVFSSNYGGVRFQRLNDHERAVVLAEVSRHVARSKLFKGLCILSITSMSAASVLVYMSFEQRSPGLLFVGFATTTGIVLALRGAFMRKTLFRLLQAGAEKAFTR